MGVVEHGLLKAVDEHGPIPVTTLADTLGAHPITVDRHCYELQRHGLLRQLSGGVYAVTDQGKDHLATLQD